MKDQASEKSICRLCHQYTAVILSERSDSNGPAVTFASMRLLLSLVLRDDNDVLQKPARACFTNPLCIRA
jgi:hypothetical protein